MTKIKLILLLCFFVQVTVSAQVKIGNNPTSINSASLLELETTNKGFVLPGVFLTSLTSSSPLPAGLLPGTMVFNTAAGIGSGIGVYYWNGTAWVAASSGGVGGGNSGWLITGNNNVTSANFLGTIDPNVPLTFKVGNVQAGFLGTASSQISTFGTGATASGQQSTAIGAAAQASAGTSSAFGYQAKATQQNALALGVSSTASGNSAVAIGQLSVGGAQNAIAIGNGAGATGSVDNIAIGTGAAASVQQGIAIGPFARATTNLTAMALGYTANASGPSSSAIGDHAAASGQNSLALGVTAVASGNASIAMGNGSLATGAQATAYGSGSQATVAGANAFGNNSIASGVSSTTLGNSSTASGQASLAVGDNSTAAGLGSIVLGNRSTAVGDNAIAIGESINITQANALVLGNNLNNIGIGTVTPGYKLTVVPQAGNNPMYLNGVQTLTTPVTTDSILTIRGGVVKQMRIADIPGSVAAGAWLLNGNSGTNTSNFIGTLDNVGFRVRTNNIQRLLVDSLGNIVIGRGDKTTTPAGDTIRGPNGSGTNIAGGNLTLTGGKASGTATGGALNLSGGVSASGESGVVNITAQDIKTKLGPDGKFLIVNSGTPPNEFVKLLIRESGEVNWYLDGKDLFMRDGFFDAFGDGKHYKYDFMHIDGTTGRIGFNILNGYSDGTPGGETNLPLTSSVTLLGSIATKVRLLDGSTSYQIKQDDHILIIDKSDNFNTDMILSLVDSSRGREYIFKRNNSGTGKIVVKPAPGEKLNGIVNASVSLGANNSVLEIVCGPDSWWVISESGIIQQAQVTTTSTTASDKNIIEVNFTSAGQGIDISLPAAADNEDKFYTIKRNANGTVFTGNVLRIVPASGENLDQSSFASPYIMENDFESVTVRSDGTSWTILNDYNAENAVVAVTTAYTPYKNDKTILADASAASFTVTLPGAATVEKGKTYTVKRTNAGANTVIVAGNGSETIDGIASLRLNQRFDYLQLESDGTNWLVIAERISPSLVLNPVLPYTATAYDGTISSNSAGTINLPGAAAVLGGKIFTIKNSATAGNPTLTVDPSGSETIDGLATWPLLKGQFITIQSDGTNWIVIGQ